MKSTNKKEKQIKYDGSKYQVPNDYLVFSESAKTLESWTGGNSYKHLLAFELFGLKVEFWKKL